MSYYQDLPPEGKQALRAEFERDTTTDERRAEILTLMRDSAEEAQMGTSWNLNKVKCPRCQHHLFYAPWTHALIEGHVYSDDGVREVYITGFCEFCFDLITEEPNTEEPNKEEETNV